MATAPTTPARPTVSANGTKPAEGKPVPTKTEGIDLSLDPADLKMAKPGENGEPSLLGYFSALSTAAVAAEVIEAKLLEVNRATAKRLRDNRIASVRIHEGKSVALDAPVGKLYRVRGVNGQHDVYQLYSADPKERKGKPAVDVNAID